MANLPVPTLPQLPPEQLDLLAEHLAAGRSPTEIAKRLHPTDRAARIRTRRKIETAILRDNKLAQRVSDRTKIDMLVGLGPSTRALVSRAKRGRPDAIKLLFEASGFHNPRVKHDHTGEIRIKLDIPRPVFEQSQVVDAEVVED